MALNQNDPSWRAVLPGRENDGVRLPGDEPDDLTRALAASGFDDDEPSTTSSDAYVTDVEDDGDMRAGDASDSDDDGEDADAFEDAAETLARGQDAAITTGLLSGVKKPASSHGTRSRRSGASTRRSGDATERGRKKSASGKSSKEALRRKAERRAYKPVTFTLLCRLFCLYASFMALVFAFVIVTALGA